MVMILTLFKYIINTSCFCLVFWKTTECIIKYLDNPRGTKLVIKYAANTESFPAITICADDDMKDGMRWNTSYLKQCGIPRY